MFFINESINQLDAGVETDIIASTLRSFVISISDVVGEIPNKDIMKNRIHTPERGVYRRRARD